jgi:hypothetical protein
MSWRDHLGEDRRLAILRLLAEAPAYKLNDSILHTVLENDIGVPATRDQVRGEIAWLGEQGLIAIETAHQLLVATLRERGLEVAKGLATHPGVKRPSPRD